jgi:cytochrome c biogenesis protein
MLFGLYVAFFMSHRRFWLVLTPAGNKTEVLLSGSANKNRAGFESRFEELGELLQSEDKEA